MASAPLHHVQQQRAQFIRANVLVMSDRRATISPNEIIAALRKNAQLVKYCRHGGNVVPIKTHYCFALSLAQSLQQ
ncbi:hypothetical protein F01_320121 [Burkholderia cenocepacia]|nr:hypothetical protein F01_320121 [Burkholderia cenocepacia]